MIAYDTSLDISAQPAAPSARGINLSEIPNVGLD